MQVALGVLWAVVVFGVFALGELFSILVRFVSLVGVTGGIVSPSLPLLLIFFGVKLHMPNFIKGEFGVNEG